MCTWQSGIFFVFSLTSPQETMKDHSLSRMLVKKARKDRSKNTQALAERMDMCMVCKQGTCHQLGPLMTLREPMFAGNHHQMLNETAKVHESRLAMVPSTSDFHSCKKSTLLPFDAHVVAVGFRDTEYAVVIKTTTLCMTVLGSPAITIMVICDWLSCGPFY